MPSRGTSPEARPARLAGSWYEGQPDRLRENVEIWTRPGREARPAVAPCMLLVPHAGHMYSGAVAGAGFGRLAGCDRVVLLAPSHRVAFPGIATPPLQLRWLKTPLGDLTVDTSLARELEAADSLFAPHDEALAVEHAVEVELPFLAHVLPKAPVLPLVCGRLSREQMRRAGQLLGERLEYGTVVVVSSDLTHYGEDYGFAPFGPGDRAVRDQIEELDSGGLEFLEGCDPDGMLDYREQHGWTACGAVPAAVGLWAMPQKCDATRVEYLSSADVSGDYERMVAYAALTLDDERPRVSPRSRARLRAIAESSARAAVATGSTPPFDPALAEGLPAYANCGVFVTLREGKHLRGCIGSLGNRDGLAGELHTVAAKAALSDPRFNPLSPEELRRCTLTVSVLSSLRPVASIEEARVPYHGLYIRAGMHTGLLLPQVAEEQGFDRDTFLQHTLLKAGIEGPMPENAVLSVFACTVF